MLQILVVLNSLYETINVDKSGHLKPSETTNFFAILENHHNKHI